MKEPSERLGVKIVGGLRETATPWAGASLLVDLFRRLELGEAADGVLPAKRSRKGLGHGQMVESFVLLSALGGECIDDMRRLREDDGLAMMLGYRPPAAEAARQWLDLFHNEALLAAAPLQGSFIPEESGPVVALRELVRRTVWAYVANVKPGSDVTLDVDAQLIETHKTDARRCYEGYKAYQPLEVCWAETMLLLADEFRQGNVPAGKDIKRMVDEAFALLPPGEWRVRVRSDSAAYEGKVLDHWDGKGWGFAVSAEMSPQLRQTVELLPAKAWRSWRTEERGVIREWAEVPYVPARGYEQSDSRPYRYVAIRVRRQQGELFEEGVALHHFAVVSNLWQLEGQELLEWHRGKAGTIEQLHHILVSDLAAGVFPSARHGANAAWLRLQVLTHNLLQVLKRAVLAAEYANAHPKRLRFAVFTVMGRLVCHAGQMLLRIAAEVLETLVAPGRRRIAALSPSPG